MYNNFTIAAEPIAFVKYFYYVKTFYITGFYSQRMFYNLTATCVCVCVCVYIYIHTHTYIH